MYILPLLTNSTASETFLHKSGAVRSVDWICITGAPAWRWLGEYVTLDKTSYSLLFQQEGLLTQYCAGGQSEKNEMGGACGAYGGGERCVQGSGWET
jgi:hypothetical protein